MTWSIIARDTVTGELGVAVATKFFAVGALVPYIAAGVGAVASQALVNPYYGIDGLKYLKQGRSPAEVLDIVKSGDEGHAFRQVHVINRSGQTAAYTGRNCLGWCGHKLLDGLSVAGNMVSGASVIEATAEAYLSHPQLPFASRLIAALEAGEAAGGDARGKQSASLRIHGKDDWPALDLRVDDHPEPINELRRLERVSRDEWKGFLQIIPTRSRPSGVTDYDLIESLTSQRIEDEQL